MENVTLLAIALKIPNKEDEFVKTYLDERDFELEDLIKEMVANDLSWKNYQSEAAHLVVKKLNFELTCKEITINSILKDVQEANSYKKLKNTAKYLAEYASEAELLQIRIKNICKDFAEEAWTEEYIFE